MPESLIEKTSSGRNDHALRYSSRWQARETPTKTTFIAHDNDGKRITANLLDDAADVILDELSSIYRAGEKEGYHHVETICSRDN